MRNNYTFFMRLFTPLPQETHRSLENLLKSIDETFPLPSRFRRGLPRDIAELSALLTNRRGDRPLSYMTRPAHLSAYLRYFLPWNVFRLCRLLPSLPLDLKPQGAIIDLGAGPLTFAIALWIALPHLRKIPLEFHCVDRAQTVLEAGQRLFSVLTRGEETAWAIKTVRGEAAWALFEKRRSLGKAGRGNTLVCAINLYNEMFQGEDFLRGAAEKAAGQLALAAENVLVAEPGVPRCGEFIADLRDSLLSEGFFPKSPCSHRGGCPFSARDSREEGEGRRRGGKKEKWCHFAFDTLDAPAALLALSESAGLPKERATLSFLLAGKTDGKAVASAEEARVLSDSFALPSAGGKAVAGRYACSGKGLLLLRGEKRAVEDLEAGSLIPLILPLKGKDVKTGAAIMDIALP